MGLRTAILLLFFLFHLPAFSVSLLTIDTDEKVEEGKIAAFTMTYIQTEGTYFPNMLDYKSDAWELSKVSLSNDAVTTIDGTNGVALFKYSLAYNSFVSFSSDLAVGNSFLAGVRKSKPLNYDATLQFTRNYANLDITLFLQGIKSAETSVPLNASNSSFNISIDTKGSLLRVWVGADTSAAPVLSHNGIMQSEGYFYLKNGNFTSSEGKGVTKFTNMSARVDYAYGLQFVFNKIKGSFIQDVDKNDSRSLFNEYVQSQSLKPNMQRLVDSLNVSFPRFKHPTKPPILSNSKNDENFFYCDNQPTSMEMPIPYSSVYVVTWFERIDSCGPELENFVNVKLYNQPDNELFISHKCPCSENTCFIDTVFIDAPANSFCEGDELKLNAVIKGRNGISADDYRFEWSLSSIALPESEPEITTSIPGNFRVKAVKADDKSCSATSVLFPVRTETKPVLSLRDTAACANAELTISAVSSYNYNPNFKYKWSTGATSRSIKVASSGSYKVRVDNGHCADSVVAVIELDTCLAPSLDSLDIQRVLSPNGDGVNEVFSLPVLAERFPNSRVALYDRSGKLLYEEDAEVFEWDGTYNGNKMPANDYWYEIYVPALYRYYIGHFTLLWE